MMSSRFISLYNTTSKISIPIKHISKVNFCSSTLFTSHTNNNNNTSSTSPSSNNTTTTNVNTTTITTANIIQQQQQQQQQQQNNNKNNIQLSTISNKVEYKILRENNNPTINLNEKEGSRTRFQWLQPPKTALIIKKHKDKKTTAWLNTVASWLKTKHGIRVLVEPNVIISPESNGYLETYSEEESHLLGKVVDFVITLGGDGTLLHVSSLFKQEVPPIISFHLGTLGFLMPFSIQDYKESIENVIKGEFLCTNRMRLICDIYSKQLQPPTTTNGNNNGNGMINHLDQQQIISTMNGETIRLVKSFQVLNEVTLHRGSNPHLTTINCTINGHNLSDIIGDGLIVATATGSTAYSMSCGGPMVHPCINCILLTPICPSSFSSKPALLPDDSILRLMMISQKGRSISATFDGTKSIKIEQGDYIIIRKSLHPLLTINKTNETTDWVHGNGKLIEMSEKSSIWSQNVYTTSAN